MTTTDYLTKLREQIRFSEDILRDMEIAYTPILKVCQTMPAFAREALPARDD